MGVSSRTDLEESLGGEGVCERYEQAGRVGIDFFPESERGVMGMSVSSQSANLFSTFGWSESKMTRGTYAHKPFTDDRKQS